MSISVLFPSDLEPSQICTFDQVRTQLEGRDRHVLDFLGVESQDTEVVDWIAVDRVGIDLLVVVEHNVAPERA